MMASQWRQCSGVHLAPTLRRAKDCTVTTAKAWGFVSPVAKQRNEFRYFAVVLDRTAMRAYHFMP
jgi:hypothetical protein